ncbi:MAG: Nif3-like dinuclear metal center hexameric protein [Candidatus Syntrophosphaera sp.]|nr:Nif3-like dinuclear metal center hexameric protein [Candidatus Syntrophosphaera sp.]
MLISELMAYIEEFAPLTLALDWDNVGLLVGDPKRPVNKVLISLDVTPNAVSKALQIGADLILSHHPLIFRPLNRITDPLLLQLIENKISVISLHTNLDVAPGGVNNALAEALGLQIIDHLTAEQGGKWYHLCVTVPADHLNAVSTAAFQAGAGKIGNYSSCSTRHGITGTFKPQPGAKPYLEQPDALGLTKVAEEELEFMVDEASLTKVLDVIKNSHPYETPLVYFFPVATPNPAYGLGLVGKFSPDLSLTEIARLVSERLKCRRPRLWTAGLSPQTKVERIAVCGGAGASILKSAGQKANLVITGDIGYHNLLDSRIPIIDAGHFYTEYPVLEYLRNRLQTKDIACEVLPLEEHEYHMNLLEQGF